MWFLASDRKIQITDLVLSDNLSTYHNLISFTSVSKLYENKGKVESDFATFEVCVRNQTRMSDGKIKVDCVSKEVQDALSSTTAGYTGRTTVNGLFSKLGFNYRSDFQSNNSYFSIPECSLTTLFDNLTKYASFANGGGAHFFMTADGVVHGYDYKLIKDKKKAYKIEGNLQSEQMNTDWLMYTPSEYVLFCWDNKNNFEKETFAITKGFGRATVDINDTTGVWKDAAKQELTNMFYNKWYSSHALNVSIPQGVQVMLGDLVDLNGLGQTYIVKSITTGINELRKMPEISAVLISNPMF